MKGTIAKSLFTGMICISFPLTSQNASADQEIYRLKPLFEMKVGKELGEYNLYFMPQPFPPPSGKKYTLFPGSPSIKVDGSGDFYIMNKWRDVVKINSRGEMAKQVSGSEGFTKPGRIELDRWDNLYVWFRNETNIAEEHRYRLAKFDKDGDLLFWIKDVETRESFKEAYVRKVSINGSVLVHTGGVGRRRTLRFDKDGNFTGFVDFPAEAEEGADGNMYLINRTVKKYTDYDGTLRTLRDMKPVSEKKLKAQARLTFAGLDVNNNMYFDLSTTYRDLELAEFELGVTDISVEERIVRYDFSQDQYDTLRCEPLVQKESKYVSSGILKNHKGEIYEIRVFFNEPNEVTPEDHVRVYKWEKVR